MRQQGPLHQVWLEATLAEGPHLSMPGVETVPRWKDSQRLWGQVTCWRCDYPAVTLSRMHTSIKPTQYQNSTA